MTEAVPNQRIDKWLWCARFFKTRTLAGKIVSAGNIKLTRKEQTQRISKASFLIQVGDTIAFTKGQRLFVIEIQSLADRRGPAPEAQALYEDHSPPPPEKKTPSVSKPGTAFERESGAGRPTKKERRELSKLREDI